MKTPEILYSYKDIVLLPQQSNIITRSSVKTKVNFLDREFDSCIIPANMKCCIDFELAEQLAYSNRFYIF